MTLHEKYRISFGNMNENYELGRGVNGLGFCINRNPPELDCSGLEINV
jgi:hypothetical protein